VWRVESVGVSRYVDDMNKKGIRQTLQAGSIVFGASGLALIVLPLEFLDLLALSQSDEMAWSMRMIGITVAALAGNMWQHVQCADKKSLRFVGRVMCVSSASLGILTLMIPAEMTWFTYLYAAVGFGFSISYGFNLVRK